MNVLIAPNRDLPPELHDAVQEKVQRAEGAEEYKWHAHNDEPDGEFHMANSNSLNNCVN